MREKMNAKSLIRNSKSDSRLLVERLVHMEVISNSDLQQIETMQITTGESYVRALTRLGLASAQLIARVQSDILEVPKAGEKHLDPDKTLFPSIDLEFVRKRAVIPFVNDDEEVSLAMVDATDSEALSMVSLVFDRTVKPYVVSVDLFQACLQSYESEVIQARPEAESTDRLSEDEIVRLEDLARESPVVSFVDGLLKRAADWKASDIHIDPVKDGIFVRFRIDGKLQVQTVGSTEPVEVIVSRIKIMAKLNIAERRLPQDGRFRQTINGRVIDFRVASIPGTFGEAVVLRLLYQNDAKLDLDHLGFHEQASQRLSAGLQSPNGIVLVTGPTGSGKSTTLYAAVQSIMNDDRKFMSVEDPVEYQIAGVTQIQVKPEIGLDFARTLRSVLRHDPNVLMLGEIRDSETAKIAFQASLTGHTVISTLHTNSAASTLTRLLEMGVEDYLVASCVRTIVAQRLVRCLCPDCKTPSSANETVLNWAGVETDIIVDTFEANGCVTCSHTGYSGRFALGEVLSITPEISNAVLKGAGESQIEQMAKQGGMISLRQAGAGAVIDGRTSFDELVSTLGDG